MKLAIQLSKNMRDTSNIWAPPLYRRLLSADKRERDMCLRCLLKIKGLIVPAQLSLSKVWWFNFVMYKLIVQGYSHSLQLVREWQEIVLSCYLAL